MIPAVCSESGAAAYALQKNAAAQDVNTFAQYIAPKRYKNAGTRAPRIPSKTRRRRSLREERRNRLGLHQLTRLVEVIVDDRLGIDTEGVVDRGQQLRGMDGIALRAGPG